jgi:hypothetical protein
MHGNMNVKFFRSSQFAIRRDALLASLLSERNESNIEQSHVKAWLSPFYFLYHFLFLLLQRTTND